MKDGGRMKKRLCLWVVAFTLAVVLFVSPAFSELKFSWGPYLRIRHEYWKNVMDLANPAGSSNRDNRNFFRIKTSLWGQVDFDKDAALYVKLSNENRPYTYFEGTSVSFPDKQPGKKGYQYDINEVYFENLYLDLKNFLDMPLDLRIGRQDFTGQYGEGFLIVDGTPADGPRSSYYNAAKASWRVDDKNTLDFIYINDPRTDQFLPVINRVKLVNYTTGYEVDGNYLTTTDEQGYMLYWKNKAVKDLALEGYYIFKRESEEGGRGIYSSEKTLLNTVGSFAKYCFAPYTLRTQFAGQWGSYGEEDRTGLGGYVYLDRDIKEIKAWSPTATVGYFYLSGDDRKTGEQEGWDPLFSQYPWISDLYMYTLTRETGLVGYWTNIHGPRIYVTMKPTGKSKVTLAYLYLRAVESVPSTANAMFSGSSKERGQSFQAKVEYTLNKHTTAAFSAEYFIPGRFYVNDDSAVFLKTELTVKF
jgi:hypothetical protein